MDLRIYSRNRGIICFLLLIIFGILIWRSRIFHRIEALENPPMVGNMKYRTFVVNMDKDVERFNKISSYYHNSDLSELPLERYSAVVGKNMEPSDWLTDDAVNDFNNVINNGYRTHHYQLTYGGIGCFLSHYNLAKQLLSEQKNIDAYIVFEDDTAIPRNLLSHIETQMSELPEDWDYLMFYTIRANGDPITKKLNKLKSFWGTNCYIMNKKGARKLVEETNANKIDGQIDSYLSRMIQQDKMNIYATKKHLVKSNALDTNIQVILKPLKGVNPYDFKGYLV
jgi:GR25 family glycosyltransferase involved in LPS biosynthesis